MRPYTKFGLEARKIMLLKGIKMKDIASHLGVSVTYISEILKGTRPGDKYKAQIAEMLGIDLQQFEEKAHEVAH